MRSLFLAASAATGVLIILAVLASALGVPDGLGPRHAAAGNGAEAARQRLMQSVGASCSEMATAFWDIDNVHRLADELTSEDSWLDSGLVFVGDIEQAASSIDGVVSSRVDNQASITIDNGDYGVLVEMGGSTSPKGRTVWVTMARERLSSEGCEP